MRKKEKSFDILSAFNGYAPGWGGMFAMLGLLLAGSLVGNLLQLAMLKLYGMDFTNNYALLVTYPVMFIVPMLYASIISRKNQVFSGTDIPVDNYHVADGRISAWLLALMCAAGTITCAIAVEPAVKLVPTTGAFWGPFYQTIKDAMEAMTGGPLWVALLSTAVFAPFFEEWLCRGMVMRGLLRKTTPAAAILVSAAFFALIHLNPWQAIPAFLLGCLFGLVYYKTGSLKLTMLMHCANNAFSVLLSQVPVFEGKEYLSEVVTDKLQYGLIWGVCLCLTGLLVARVWKLD